MAPLVAFGMGAFTRTICEESPAANLLLLVTELLFVAAGLALGVLALFGIRAHGRKGILKPAIVGIAVNVLIIVLCTFVFFTVKEATRQEMERLGRDAVFKYPGWLGGATFHDAVITVGSVDDKSEAAREINDSLSLGAKASLLLVAVDNSAGEAPLTFDPSSLRLHLTDGAVQPVLATRTVLETARKHREALLDKYSGPFRVLPGVKPSVGVAFIPYGFDVSRVLSISIRINGQDEMIEGQHLTKEGKAELYQKGLEARRQTLLDR